MINKSTITAKTCKNMGRCEMRISYENKKTMSGTVYGSDDDMYTASVQFLR